MIADADLAWATTTAGDQKTYAVDEAAILRDYTVNEAAIYDACDVAVAQKGAACDMAYAAAAAACDATLTADDNACETAVGNALADFWSAEYSAEASVMVTFASTLGTPWAAFEQDLAAAKNQWWGTSGKGDYLQWIADVNALSLPTSTRCAWGQFGVRVNDRSATVI